MKKERKNRIISTDLIVLTLVCLTPLVYLIFEIILKYKDIELLILVICSFLAFSVVVIFWTVNIVDIKYAGGKIMEKVLDKIIARESRKNKKNE